MREMRVGGGDALGIPLPLGQGLFIDIGNPRARGPGKTHPRPGYRPDRPQYIDTHDAVGGGSYRCSGCPLILRPSCGRIPAVDEAVQRVLPARIRGCYSESYSA